jgi:dipeptidyl aminopeptidase/acylaminoacyl peptidase
MRHGRVRPAILGEVVMPPLTAAPARLLAALVAVACLVLGAPATAQAQNGVIAFSAKSRGDRALFTRAPDGTRLRGVTTFGRADHASFSPRGRRLAYTKYGPQGAQVFVTYLEGFGRRRLTTGPADTMPDWDRTGANVVFSRGRRGRRDLYRIRADGFGLRRLTASRLSDDSPSWSARDQIAFVRRGSRGARIYVTGGAGGRARRLTRGPADGSPAWSASGRTLVFARGRPGRRDLYLVRADGSGLRRLTRVPGDESQPEFSPDGRRIVFTHRRSGIARIYVMRVRGGPVARLPRRGRGVRRLTSGRSAAREPSWQPVRAPVVAVAGDIACDPADDFFNGGAGVIGICRQRATSDLLMRADLSRILIPGDAQYENGALEAFKLVFDPTWGRLKPLIRPVPGNHEYGERGAAGYFDYFNGPGQQDGPAGKRDEGYYSFDLGSWHVVGLNSECLKVAGFCGPGSRQARWLRADLAASRASCTLAFWHGPRFTSGRFGEERESVRPFWEALYAANAELVLNGHEHFYERFAPQTPEGIPDPGRGLRQITAGMGGRGHHDFVTVAPNSEVRDNLTLGVLQLTLGSRGYEWQLVRAPGGRVVDSGSGTCH